MRHHFTVDVEEYFHASAMEPHCPARSWDELPRRSTPVMHRLLDRLGEKGVRGTFFVLGWLAAREPEVVRRITREGHELASHGWDHKRVPAQTPGEFRISVRNSRSLLEDLSGTPVRGFRAPSFSIVPGLEWALDVLIEEGYRYDSSLFPVRQHPTYGYPCPPDPHWIVRPPGRIAEVPPCTLRRLGTTFPAAGGAYFRFFPYGLLRAALLQAQARSQPGTFYIHPWEFDPVLPTAGVPALTRLRMTGGTTGSWDRVDRLLDEFSFVPMGETVDALPLPAEVA